MKLIFNVIDNFKIVDKYDYSTEEFLHNDKIVDVNTNCVVCGDVLYFILERVVAGPEGERRGVFLFSFPCEVEEGEGAEQAGEAADDASGHEKVLLCVLDYGAQSSALSDF